MLPPSLQRLLRILRIRNPRPQPLRRPILIMYRNRRRPRFKHLHKQTPVSHLYHHHRQQQS